MSSPNFYLISAAFLTLPRCLVVEKELRLFFRVTLNVNSYCCHPPSPALNSSCLSWGILTWCCVLWSSGLLNITDFLTDFSVFLADIMPKYDQILIVGDCNIHVCCPCMLFKVINSVLNAPLTGTEASTAVCENVLHYFIDKVTSTRALIPPPASDPSVFVPHSVVLYKFEPVTLPFVQETVGHLKPSGSPNDTVPPQIFKQAFPTVGSSCLTIINLSSGVVPANLKHAVVQPLLKKKKKRGWILLFWQITGLSLNCLSSLKS